MATTNFGVNHPMAVKVWARKLFEETLSELYFSRFIGTDNKSMIVERPELKKGPGDKITYGLRAKLTGRGVPIDNDREGEEEQLSIYSDSLLIEGLTNQVVSQGKMSEQRVPFTLRDEVKSGLQLWWGERLDTVLMNQLCGNTAQTDLLYTGHNATIAPDASHIIRLGSTTTDASLSTVDTMSLDVIDKALERAKTISPLVNPFMVGGEPHYVMFLHPYQVYDLTKNTSDGQWFSIQKAALTSGERFADNPLFTGALGIYKKVILQESVYMPLGCDSTTAAANTRRAILCGAQAACLAYGGSGGNEMNWIEKRFNYESRLGVSTEMIFGIKKTRFNGQDFGVITIPTFAAAHS